MEGCLTVAVFGLDKVLCGGLIRYVMLSEESEWLQVLVTGSVRSCCRKSGAGLGGVII